MQKHICAGFTAGIFCRDIAGIFCRDIAGIFYGKKEGFLCQYLVIGDIWTNINNKVNIVTWIVKVLLFVS